MNTKQYLLILSLVALATCSSVVNLTDQNFNSTISGHKYVMVKFFAPWCGHCKTMAPEYQKLAQLAKDNGVVIGQVDATISKIIAEAHKVQGFPTIKFFIDGFGINYNGARTADAMYGWIKTTTQAVLQEINEEKINQLKSKQNFVVYFGNSAQKRKQIELLNIADKTTDYFINPSGQGDKIVLYVVGKDSKQYNLELNTELVKTWVMMNSMPDVVPLSSKQYLDWVFYDEATLKDVIMLLRQKEVTDAGFQNFQNFCRSNKQSFKCCYITSQMEVYGGVKGYLKSKGQSVLALTQDSLKKGFVYTQDINTISNQSWAQFKAEVDENKHKNIAGAENDKLEFKHVNVLTDDNFTSFIKENPVVFIEFYSPGCAHCVQFAPTFDILAQQVHSDATLNYKIAAIDVRGNKQVAADTRISSFPSFRVYLSVESYVTYEGPRTRQDILKFIKTVLNSKPILAGSLAEVPTPSVVIYDAAETTSLNLLPALFTRYPIYHIREGDKLSVVLKRQSDKTYEGEQSLQKVAKWLNRETDPILVDLLNSNLDNKLMEALQSKTPLIALFDVDPELSAPLRKTLEDYCKDSTLVCGCAKKGDANYKQFSDWATVKAQTTPQILYINTQTYDKYLFNQKIEQLSIQTLSTFIQQVKQGKIEKMAEQAPQKQQQTKAKQQTKEADEAESDQSKQGEQQSKQSDQSKQSKQSKQSEQSNDSDDKQPQNQEL